MWKCVGKETWGCIRRCWKQLLLFEILYRTAWYTGFGTLLRSGLQFMLEQKDYSYLTAENFETFMAYPGTILIFLAGILFFLITLLFELAALFSCFDSCKKETKHWSVFDMVQEGLMRSGRLLRRYPLESLLGIGLLTPFLCGFYLVEEGSRIKFLNYFFQFLAEHSSLWVLGITGAAVLLAAFFSMLSVPGALHSGKSLRHWGKNSAWLIKEHWLMVFLWTLLWQMVLLVITTLVYGLGSLSVAAYVRVFEPQEVALSVLLVLAEDLQGFSNAFAGGLGVVLMGSLLYALTKYLHGEEPSLVLHSGTKTWSVAARLLTALLLGLFLTAIWQAFYPLKGTGESLYDSVQVTAHRGAAKSAPENTMAALENAVNKLSDYVEIDVQETKDGVLVLLHDNNLKRTTGLNQNIWNVNYEVVECLDAGKWFKKEFAGEHIPRLEQALDYCKGKLLVNIEVKANGHNGDIVEKVVQEIKDHDMVDQCVLTSMSYAFLKRAKELEPELRTGYTMAMAYGNVELLDYADFLSVKHTYVTDEFVKAAHACGKEVHVWTVNSRYHMKRMIMLNVDNLITDRPEMAVQVLAEESGQETYLELLRYMMRS